MPEEMNLLMEQVQHKNVVACGDRVYYEGMLNNVPVVVAFSRWGKVAAATTITTLILKFKVDSIIFTGIAGSVSSELAVGDIVVAERLFQHDMDARPLMRRFEIPLTGQTSYQLPDMQVRMAEQTVHNFLKKRKDFRAQLAEHHITQPKLARGDIASGDLFIASQEMRDKINRNLPSVLCADMESAAAAQVCADFQVPLAVIRVISDGATAEAHQSAMDFVLTHGSKYTVAIINEYLELLKTDDHH